MVKMKKIIEAKKTCEALPEQYQGRLDTGEFFYIRMRFGKAEMRIGNQEQLEKWELPTVALIDTNEEFLVVFDDNLLNELLNEAWVEDGVGLKALKPPSPEEIMAYLSEQAVIAENSPEDAPPLVITFDEDVRRGKLVLSGETKELTLEDLKNLQNVGNKESAFYGKGTEES